MRGFNTEDKELCLSRIPGAKEIKHTIAQFLKNASIAIEYAKNRVFETLPKTNKTQDETIYFPGIIIREESSMEDIEKQLEKLELHIAGTSGGRIVLTQILFFRTHIESVIEMQLVVYISSSGKKLNCCLHKPDFIMFDDACGSSQNFLTRF